MSEQNKVNTEMYTEDKVKALIKTGLKNYQIILKDALKVSEFKKLDVAQRANAARVLVLLSDVANNPDKYIGYKETSAVWNARKQERVRNGDYKKVKTTEELTDIAPEAFVHNAINSLPEYVSGIPMSAYKHFITLVREWNYAIANQAKFASQGQIKMAEEYKRKAIIKAQRIEQRVCKSALQVHYIQASGIKHLLGKFAYNMQYN